MSRRQRNVPASNPENKGMFRGRRRWLIRIALVVVIAMLGLVWAEREKERHRLVVENHSGEVLTRVDIKAGSDSSSFTDVANDASVVAPFSVDDKDKYAIHVEARKAGISNSMGVLGATRHFIVLPGGQIVAQGKGRN